MRFFLAPYPALRLLAVAVGGIISGLFLPGELHGWLLVSCAGLLLVPAFLVRDHFGKQEGTLSSLTVLSYLGLVFCASATFTLYNCRYVPGDSLMAWVGRDVIISGEVDGKPEITSSGAVWRMHVSELFHEGRNRKIDDRATIVVRLSGGETMRLQPGDFVRVKGRLRLLPTAANRGEYDARRQNGMKGLYVQIYCPGRWLVLQEKAARPPSFQRSVVNPLRNYIADTIDRRFPPGEEQRFVKGMVLGERDLLPDEMYTAFKRTGTAHVLAVSGLHVALLAFGINVCLQRLKVTAAGRFGSFLLLTAILVTYSFVTGNSPSVVRAAIMSVAMLAGETLGRKSYPVNSLAFADLVILLLDPSDLVNPGFLMTNAAVLGILLLYAPLNDLVRNGKGVLRRSVKLCWSSFCVSLAAITGVWPVIAFYFGSFSLAGIAANLPVVLFSNLAMYAVIPMLLLNLFSAPLASMFATSAWLFARLTLFFTMQFNQFPMASLPLKLDLVQVVVVYSGMAAALVARYRHAWGGFAISMFIAANLLFWYGIPRSHEPSPALLTVNLGRNVAFIVSTGSESVLIDCGRREKEMERITRQAELFALPKPEAVAGFFTPDSLLGRMAGLRTLKSGEGTLTLKSIIVARTSDKVVRVWSRRHSILFVSGMGRLRGESPGGADLVVLWIHRFMGKQYRELDLWLSASKVRQVVLVPGPFLSRPQKGLLERFAREHPGTLLRRNSSQIVIR